MSLVYLHIELTCGYDFYNCSLYPRKTGYYVDSSQGLV